MSKSSKYNYLALVAALMVAACARSPIKNQDQAMRAAKQMPTLADDLGMPSLIHGLETNIHYLETSKTTPAIFKFGPTQIGKEDYLRSLHFLVEQANRDKDGAAFRAALNADFQAYEVYGQKEWGEVFITSYFEPVIAGAKKRAPHFSQALYGLPKDLVVVDVNAFATTFPKLSTMQNQVLEQRSREGILRGRLIAGVGDDPPRILPYLDRREIDDSDIMSWQKIELAWVDPIDSFFLQIQGSGVVQFTDGTELRVGYAAQNGHPYVAIGKFLLDKIPKDKMSLQSIESYLRSLSEREARDILNLNPSYVFFKPLEKAGLTFLGTEVVAGRTIATDQSYFPKGALAFLQYQRPVFANPKDETPASFKESSRFVLDQDTGGAIRGPDRVDLFWGRGAEAKQFAGQIRHKGRLVYFVPKASLIERLRGGGRPTVGKP